MTNQKLDRDPAAKVFPKDAIERSRLPRREDVRISMSLTAKRCLDVIITLLALVLAAPLILVLMVSLLAMQGRPLFFVHRRIGRNGVLFGCLKFRTMVSNAQEVLLSHLASNDDAKLEWETTQKLRNDPRITRLGRLLRKSSLDELPQLLNVLRGEMSLVGPRPIVPSESQFYGSHFHDYCRLKPGLTGLWQVSGRSDATYRERVELDVRYVRSRTVWFDLMIMLKTIPAVIASRGSY